jgi:tetratricopeptide (TPR) repeat protein
MHRFDIASPWAGFFDQLRQDELPRIHEVHQLLGQLRDAADAALRYLLQRPETEAAPRAVALSEGQNQVLREFVQKGAWLEAIRLVRGTAESLRGKERVAKLLRAEDAKSLRAEDNEEYIRSEVTCLEDILGSLVRIARASLREESRNARPGAEVFRRWSAIEEAVDNFLEAGLQAELGQDYVTAALMFEKAGAFKQTRRAFDRSPRSDLERRAELLERGGDFSTAARLYERLGQTEKVLEMYEQEGFWLTTDLH